MPEFFRLNHRWVQVSEIASVEFREENPDCPYVLVLFRGRNYPDEFTGTEVVAALKAIVNPPNITAMQPIPRWSLTDDQATALPRTMNELIGLLRDQLEGGGGNVEGE